MEQCPTNFLLGRLVAQGGALAIRCAGRAKIPMQGQEHLQTAVI